jgi:Mrp family chromosome partitioning ATPase
MASSRHNSGNPLVPSGRTSSPVNDSASDYYDSPDRIAIDLKTDLLAEFRFNEELASWQKGLSVLSDCGWVERCEPVVQKLVRLREISPLDVVGVSALTEDVPLRPFVCALGVAMRKLLQRVVLLDCDLRSPSLHTVTNAEGVEGFIDMVKYGCSFFASSRETECSGLYIVSAGSHPVSSEGELVGKELERVFNSLRAKADVALVIVPPFPTSRRVNPLLSYVDGVLLCVNRKITKKSRVTRDLARLWQSDVPVVGMVNHESCDFEERKTLVLGASADALETAAPTRASLKKGVAPASDSTKPASVSTDSSLPVDSVPPAKMPLDHIPECKPLLEGGSEVSGSGRFFSTQPAENGVGSQAPASQADLERSRHGAEDVPDGEASATDAGALDEELFGRRRFPKKLRYIVGLSLVVVFLALVLVVPRLMNAPGKQMDESLMRSILLPGSDGVVSSDKTGPGTVQEQSRQEEKASTTAEVSVPPAVSGLFFVQVSSHEDYDGALEDSVRVAKTGVGVIVRVVNLGKLGLRYRVLAGPFDSKSEARTSVSKIESLGLVRNLRIIQEGVSD